MINIQPLNHGYPVNKTEKFTKSKSYIQFDFSNTCRYFFKEIKRVHRKNTDKNISYKYDIIIFFFLHNNIFNIIEFSKYRTFYR